MKKRNVELFYLLTLILDAFACAMLTKSDFGVSVLSSLPYVLSYIITNISYGTFSTIIQIILLVILISITKQIKITYIMSFLVGIAYGIFLDIFMYLFSFISMTLTIRVMMFVLGFVILCKVQAGYFVSKLPLMPFDAFVADLVHYTGISLFKIKTAQDLTFLLSSIILSIIFFHKIIGVSVGTVIIALFTGYLQQKTINYLNSNFKFECSTKLGTKLQEMAKIESKNI